MKKSMVRMLFLLTIVSISCQPKGNKDALSLNAELQNNSSPNTLSSEEEKNGWKLLFDGKTMQGWHEFNQKTFSDLWKIEDGALTITSRGGKEDRDIVTNQKYRSFALSVEYKLAKGSNSGLIYHIAEDPKYKAPYETGPEFQIIDHENWMDPLEDWQISGANYAMYPPKVKPYKPIGEWNHILLVVDGNKVTQILNGEEVVSYEKYSDDWTKRRNSGKWKDFPDYGKFDEGHISLQNHGTQAWFRNIKIKEL